MKPGREVLAEPGVIWTPGRARGLGGAYGRRPGSGAVPHSVDDGACTGSCRPRPDCSKFPAPAPFDRMRAGPPFPYLRWTGPPLTRGGPLQRGGEVRRQRRAHVDRLAGDGMGEREPLRVQELAVQAEHAGAPVLRI